MNILIIKEREKMSILSILDIETIPYNLFNLLKSIIKVNNLEISDEFKYILNYLKINAIDNWKENRVEKYYSDKYKSNIKKNNNPLLVRKILDLINLILIDIGKQDEIICLNSDDETLSNIVDNTKLDDIISSYINSHKLLKKKKNKTNYCILSKFSDLITCIINVLNLLKNDIVRIFEKHIKICFEIHSKITKLNTIINKKPDNNKYRYRYSVKRELNYNNDYDTNFNIYKSSLNPNYYIKDWDDSYIENDTFIDYKPSDDEIHKHLHFLKDLEKSRKWFNYYSEFHIKTILKSSYDIFKNMKYKYTLTNHKGRGCTNIAIDFMKENKYCYKLKKFMSNEDTKPCLIIEKTQHGELIIYDDDNLLKYIKKCVNIEENKKKDYIYKCLKLIDIHSLTTYRIIELENIQLFKWCIYNNFPIHDCISTIINTKNKKFLQFILNNNYKENIFDWDSYYLSAKDKRLIYDEYGDNDKYDEYCNSDNYFRSDNNKDTNKVIEIWGKNLENLELLNYLKLKKCKFNFHTFELIIEYVTKNSTNLTKENIRILVEWGIVNCYNFDLKTIGKYPMYNKDEEKEDFITHYLYELENNGCFEYILKQKKEFPIEIIQNIKKYIPRSKTNYISNIQYNIEPGCSRCGSGGYRDDEACRCSPARDPYWDDDNWCQRRDDQEDAWRRQAD